MKSPLDNSRYLSDAQRAHHDGITLILGGGLAGLSGGYALAKAGKPVAVFERDPVVGGLSRTVIQGDFRFDLGGHRFFTKKTHIEQFVKDILDGEFLTVPRKSKIYMRDKFFDYPLKPYNAIFGLGISTTLKVLFDYTLEKMKNLVRPSDVVSLEDWVVSNFGRTMFNLYFQEYSEKIWGIECKRISKEWVSQRIRGLSLWVAIKNAFFRFSGRGVDTLVDRFIYPPSGIGEISEKLRKRIEEKDHVLTNTCITRIHHDDFSIKGVTASNCGHLGYAEGDEFVSSIPLTKLVQLLDPPAPQDIRDAAAQLLYRDIVIVTVMLDRERVTDLTWIYVPEKKMPLGRIHEPKNWSSKMAPEGKTHIVAEYFCFEGDEVWSARDEDLSAQTVEQLEKLGFVKKHEVIDSCVIRVPKAYPVFDIGYSEHYHKVVTYLESFHNLHICGRGGMFRYYNMDDAIESGLDVAEHILQKPKKGKGENSKSTGNRFILTPVT
jgi:protoporphyrinogen oxidase